MKSANAKLLAAAAVFAAAPLLAGDLADAELAKPVELVDASGEPETTLVDPFRRRSAEDGAPAGEAPGEDGLMRTAMGEISSEFRILAITIPENAAARRAALIQFYNSDEPILVHEGDLVRVDRAASRRPSTRRRAAVASAASLEDELQKFVFYLNVKHIEPTYIEVYHNKKRPDETIRLNW